MECTASEGVREAVAAGLGVGFISRLALPAVMISEKLKILKIKGFTIRRDIFLVYRHGKTLSRPAALLADELRRLSRKKA
ncbi:MAG TPA: LysR substrate-binding domain-containing protein [Spirochaetota bacterium]|nr:LysR substrate-binding domain-containing protein [Spirochaetota bacterium]